MKKLEAQVNWSGAYDQRKWYVRIDNNFTGKTTSIDVGSKTDADTLAQSFDCVGIDGSDTGHPRGNSGWPFACPDFIRTKLLYNCKNKCVSISFLSDDRDIHNYLLSALSYGPYTDVSVWPNPQNTAVYRVRTDVRK